MLGYFFNDFFSCDILLLFKIIKYLILNPFSFSLILLKDNSNKNNNDIF